MVTPTETAQSKEFERVARELECDEDEDRFNATLKKIAKEGAKPKLTEECDSESMDHGDGC